MNVIEWHLAGAIIVVVFVLMPASLLARRLLRLLLADQAARLRKAFVERVT